MRVCGNKAATPRFIRGLAPPTFYATDATGTKRVAGRGRAWQGVAGRAIDSTEQTPGERSITNSTGATAEASGSSIFCEKYTPYPLHLHRYDVGGWLLLRTLDQFRFVFQRLLK